MADTFETTSASSEQNDKLRMHSKRKRPQQFGETSIAAGFEAKAEQPSIHHILPLDSLRCMSPEALGANIAATLPEFAGYSALFASAGVDGAMLASYAAADDAEFGQLLQDAGIEDAIHRQRIIAELRLVRSRYERVPQAQLRFPPLTISKALEVQSSNRARAGKWAPTARTSRNYFATALELKRSIDKGDLASMADLSWLLLHGREGLPADKAAAFKLAQEGSRRGCPHSQGVLALCYSSSEWCHIADSDENAATARRLASCSAEAGSKYGQFALGWILQEEDDEWAASRSATSRCIVQYALAAAQGLDYAQLQLAICGCSSDAEEALRLSYMAAAQGLPDGFEHLADITFNLDERIYWHHRALAAGHSCAKHNLQLELQRAAQERARAPP